MEHRIRLTTEEMNLAKRAIQRSMGQYIPLEIGEQDQLAVLLARFIDLKRGPKQRISGPVPGQGAPMTAPIQVDFGSRAGDQVPIGAMITTQTAIDGFLESCRGRGLAPKSITNYNDILKRFAKACEQLPSEPGPIEHFFAQVEGGRETKRNYHRVLTMLYNHWCPRLKIDSPMILIRRPSKSTVLPASFSEAEIPLLLKACESDQERALILTPLDTCVRLEELVGMKWCHIDRKSRIVKIKGKTGEREAPISDYTIELLDKIRQGDDLWVSERFAGQVLSYEGVKKKITRIIVRAGFSDRKHGPHTLRHTFGRRWIAGGGDIFSLKQIGGWKTLDMVQVYVYLDEQEMRAAHKRFTPIHEVIAKEENNG